MHHTLAQTRVFARATTEKSKEYFFNRKVLRLVQECAPGLAILLVCIVSYLLWQQPSDLSVPARISLIVTLLCTVLWVMPQIPDSLVALGGAAALVVTGAIPVSNFYASLGHELIWLLVAAFILAATVRHSGLLEPVAHGLLKRCRTVKGLFYATTLLVAITAFFIPSTSGRAALMLPVFWSVIGQCTDAKLTKPLALLFPTVILLSAGASLIGAGAHLIAIDVLAHSGIRLGYLDWLLLCAPMCLIASFTACSIILHLFVENPRAALQKSEVTTPVTTFGPVQKRVAGMIMLLVGLWVSTPLHGIDMALVTLLGASLSLIPAFAHMKAKDLFKNVEIELLVFLAMTTVIAEALVSSGASQWLAKDLLSMLPSAATVPTPVIVAFVAAVSIASHLLVNSRSARAAILVPSLALPLAALGHDPLLLVMVATLASGVCQTTVASAKPVAVYAKLDVPTFDSRDLLRLALPIAGLKFVLVVAFAVLVWPYQGGAKIALAQPTTVDHEVSNALGRPTDGIVEMAEGTMCSTQDLSLVMTKTIADKKLWRSGWWNVWREVKRQGIPATRGAVRSIYKAEDMVRLRISSSRIRGLASNAASVQAATAACQTKF